MIIAIASILSVGVLLFILGVRAKDLPEPQPVSPFQHLDERKSAIYDNLRDLQFEYRLGKLSDTDYQATKRDLQKELAAVMAEIDRVREQVESTRGPVEAARRKQTPPAPAKPEAAENEAAAKDPAKFVCPHCGAGFEMDLKFCGECGKPMKKAGEA